MPSKVRGPKAPSVLQSGAEAHACLRQAKRGRQALHTLRAILRDLEHHSAAQPQPNGDAEGTAGVAWQPLSRAAL